MGSDGLYRRLLRTPQLIPLIALSLVARLPLGILSLAFVLFLREQTGSFATAGAVAAAFALCGGLFAPLQGRLVDRLGQTRVLVPLVLVHSGSLVAVIGLGLAHAPPALTAVFAALAGAANPPVSACSRPLLIELLEHDGDLLRAGYALDSISIEAVFIAGPLITGLVAGVFAPAVAIGVGAALGLGGTLGFVAMPLSRAWRGQATTSGIVGALASPGMRTLLLTTLPIGICFGTLEVALPAFGAEHGAARVGGYLFAGLSVGSVVGGLAYGAAAGRLGPVERAYLLLVAALPVCLLVLLLPDSVALMFVLVPFAGCVIAPLTAAENQILSAVAPPGAATEAFTWLIMSTVVGVAAGNAVAGALAQAVGWQESLLVACAIAALGAAASFSRRATLRAPGAQRA
ncbi:MAG: hypothetical protein QOF55_998 [Thermoleophilaceae bacterium]|nr:hypothetical protein [Thermoleophilaceae bacterium]